MNKNKLQLEHPTFSQIKEMYLNLDMIHLYIIDNPLKGVDYLWTKENNFNTNEHCVLKWLHMQYTN